MLMQIREVVDREEWEIFLLKNNPAALFQSWDWGEVQLKSGNKVIRYGWYQEDSLQAISQIVLVNAKRGVFLHIRHGPVMQDNSTAAWDSVISFLRKLAREQHALFVRISPLIPDSADVQARLREYRFIPAAIHAMDAELCWLLDVTPKEDELLKAMRKTTRYEVRKAQNLGVKIRISESVDDLKFFYALYEQTVSRHKFIGHRGITEEFSVFSSRNQAVLLTGEYEGKILAAAIVLFYGKQGIYHHGASVSSKVPVSSLVQWEAIRLTKERGYPLYNFWGIADDANEHHPWKGLSLFKKGFGGYEQKYLHAHDLPIHPLYFIPRSVEIVRKRMKGY